MSTFSVRIDTSGIEAALGSAAARMHEATRPAAQAGAQVLYDAVRRNVDAIGAQTGNLKRAVYQAFSRDNSGPGRSTYHVSWNARKAPHGHLIEWGHWQPFVSYIGSDGRWYTAVRPEKRGTPKPSRRASFAVKSAYYLPLRQPRWVEPKPFIRPALAALPAARDAMVERYKVALKEAGVLA